MKLNTITLDDDRIFKKPKHHRGRRRAHDKFAMLGTSEPALRYTQGHSACMNWGEVSLRTGHKEVQLGALAAARDRLLARHGWYCRRPGGTAFSVLHQLRGAKELLQRLHYGHRGNLAGTEYTLGRQHQRSTTPSTGQQDSTGRRGTLLRDHHSVKTGNSSYLHQNLRPHSSVVLKRLTCHSHSHTPRLTSRILS